MHRFSFGQKAALLAAVLASSVTMRAGQQTPTLSSAIQAGDRTAVAALLKSPGAAKVVEPDGTTPLHWAVRADDLATARLLLRAGANAGAVNRYGVTPLSLAAVNGNAEMIALLIEAGANANSEISLRNLQDEILFLLALDGSGFDRLN